ncbi:DNA translocase FtsK [Leucothrix mucor]|uniref:DNA translocase FtsK n=1 Tax=Leucothrix mucor TaxID=45248 RepID=UPI0003B60FA3|nr:DNA translocase FtsK [Leucothrix mucor]
MAEKGIKNKLNAQKLVSLQQTSILFFSGLSAVILLALVSFNPDDPSFFQFNSDAIIQNKAGRAGAYLASILIGFFGYLAYLIPISLLYFGFFLFRPLPSHGGLNTWLTVIGVFLALLCGCGLITLLWPESTLTYKAGGLLGLMMAKAMVAVLGDFGSTVSLFCGFFAGLTLLLDISWLKVIDRVGEGSLWLFDRLIGEPESGASGKSSKPKKPLIPNLFKKGPDKPAGKAPKSAPKTKSKGPSTAPTEEAYDDYDDEVDMAAQPAAKAKTSAKQKSASWVSGLTEKGSGVLAKLKKPTTKKSADTLDAFEGLDDYDEIDEQDIPVVREVVSGGGARNAPAPQAAAPAPTAAPAETLSIPDNMIGAAPQKPAAPAEVPVAEEEYSDLTPVALPQAAKTQAPEPARQVPKVAQAPRKPAPKSYHGDKLGLLPPLDMLEPAPKNQDKFSDEQLDALAENIQSTLSDYGIHGVEVVDRFPGPVVTRFELDLPPGTKVSRISGLGKDIARSMRVPSIRIVEVIPGKTTIGLEIPNDTRELVAISEILNAPIFQNAKSPLTLAMGKTIAGNPAIADLAKMPHVLVAGTTGSGKSVAVNAMIMSLLYKSTPDKVKLILIDPKMLELSIYEGIPHLLTSVVTDMKDAANALRWCVGEMEKRYAAMSYMKVRNIAGYNAKVQEAIDRGEPITDPSFDPTQHIDTRPSTLEPYPYIVVVIDEFADMIMVVGKKVEELIARLAQKARASGIHLILATQRPSVDVITGLIKANIPSRIAFQVSTKIDSRTILDQGGAEQLLGNGDMLYMPPGTGLPQRIHGAFVSDEEVEEVVNYLKEHGEPQYLDDVLKDTGGASAPIPGLEPLSDSEGDDLYDQAVGVVTESRRASISYLQRRLKIGYNRAASMIEAMEDAGVVSEVQSNGTREVLAPPPVKD